MCSFSSLPRISHKLGTLPLLPSVEPLSEGRVEEDEGPVCSLQHQVGDRLETLNEVLPRQEVVCVGGVNGLIDLSERERRERGQTDIQYRLNSLKRL